MSNIETVAGYVIRFDRKGPTGLRSDGWWAYVPGFVPCFVEKKAGRWFAFNGPRGVKLNRRTRQVAAQAWFSLQVAAKTGNGAGIGVYGPQDVWPQQEITVDIKLPQLERDQAAAKAVRS